MWCSSCCVGAERLEWFRVGLYLAVPFACVWLYNQPTINRYIEGKVSRGEAMSTLSDLTH